MPTTRSTVIISTAAAALLLTGCSDPFRLEPLRHGEVVKKYGRAGHWVPVYEDIYRDNCTKIHTSALTVSLPARTVGGTGGRSTTGGGGKSLTSGGTGTGGTRNGGKPRTTGGNDGGAASGSSGSSTGGSTKQCQQEYVGRKKTGKQWEPGKWQLKLRDGDRTAWIKVSKHTYDDTDLHDHI
ncbi:hypothetical protein [Streptomyces sp. MZ04]|uniref:hypothetical protein n=1 Tax=Streptomyces sp. MZ04 TaxID=2559236 RepID=UPI00107E7EC0|nr:hypothetical protein [Streptomyces sp. MZ04]TGB07384.1 hypothetical protein E2651_21755 [Streptomyces sp. MZ04]